MESMEIRKGGKSWNTTHNRFVKNKPKVLHEGKHATRRPPRQVGLKACHLDAWEMGDGRLHFASSVSTLLAVCSCFVLFSTRLVDTVAQTLLRIHRAIRLRVIGINNPFYFSGSLRRAIPAIKRAGLIWIMVLVVSRECSTLERSPNYIRL